MRVTTVQRTLHVWGAALAGTDTRRLPSHSQAALDGAETA
jgi:hypothetical protein